MKPRVAILATGGTIAGRWDAERAGIVPALSGAEMVALAPALREVAEVEAEQIANIDSSDMTPELWVRLAERANALLAEPGVAGIVVTHGTDTLEETAYFLDLTAASDKPVVLTGAQRPLHFADSDALRNLVDAVRVAVSPESCGKGALVVMNGQINAARDVTKTRTTEREAFQSPEFGMIGVADMELVRFYRTPLRIRKLALPPGARLGRVEIVLHYAGADGLLIRSLLAAAPDLQGLVVAATGLGQVSKEMFQTIELARARELPVVISSRVATGRVIPLYGSPGGVGSLRSIGCVLADNLSPVKARVLLMVALQHTRDPALLQPLFDW